MVPDGDAKYAAWLDGMEHFGRPIKLDEIAQGRKFDFLVTGASAVSKNGVRFGKGHGFFDLEWGMFTDVGVVDEKTVIAAVIHECQLVEEDLTPSETDILVDYIVTPMELHRVLNRVQRPSGIKWSLLNNDQIQDTPPIQELQKMQGLK
jgi:5-formyltetrahydrofolate cyclo-ligase